jgi:hypothetical protein
LLVFSLLQRFRDIPLRDSSSRSAAENDVREVILGKQMMEWVASGDKNEKDAKTQSENELAHQLNFPIFRVEIEEEHPSAEVLQRSEESLAVCRGNVEGARKQAMLKRMRTFGNSTAPVLKTPSSAIMFPCY